VFTCHRTMMLLIVMGLAGGVSSATWAGDSDRADATDMPVTEIATLRWDRSGELIVEPTRIGNRLADAVNDANTGHTWDDDDDEGGDWDGSWDSGYSSEDDDDEDEFKGACGCHSTMRDPGFGVLAVLALGLTVIGRRRRTHI